MATINLNAALYNEAKDYAHAQNMNVDEWIASLIIHVVSVKKNKYRMKKIEELTPELQQMIGFARPATGQGEDLNGDNARTDYLKEKFNL